MENKSTKPARKQALRKTDVMRWLDFPAHQPNLGEEIVVCWTSVVSGTPKKEIVEWTWKMMNTAANNGAKFKFIRLPAFA